MIMRQVRLKDIVFNILVLVVFFGLSASSYQSSDGELKYGDVTIKVHWADVYNMRPKPKHWTFTEVSLVLSSNNYQPPYGNCNAVIEKKKYRFKNGKVKISKSHITLFTISCSFKSSKDSSMLSFTKTFSVKRKPAKNLTLYGPLVIKPVN